VGQGPRGRRRRPSSLIHQGLTGARALVGTGYMADPVLRQQYADEIAPRTRAALGKILAELYGVEGRAPRRVLDLGAGTGAVGATLRAHFGGGLDLVAVDRVPGPGVVVADLERTLPRVEGRFELIVAAHLLNEMFVGLARGDQSDARARRVLAWAGLLASDGVIVLVEPALRETSRALLAVRDLLLVSGLHVVAPCSWNGPCPALARERDWCHDAAPVPSAPRVDFSYLVLSASSGTEARDNSLFRVVSDPLVEKGKLRIFGCGPAGRHPLVRLDRHATEANAAFDDLVRGDVATVAGTQFARDGLRVTPDTIVRRVTG
jgi:ribosomal protein RSM22 (predicted rRNA methylase)